MRWLVFGTMLLFARTVHADRYLYLSVKDEQRIAVYHADLRDGALEHTHDLHIEGEPGALANDPQRRFLFASIRSTGELASFRIDPSSGSLTLISTVPAGADPAYVATDRTGRYLLSAYYVAGKVMVHAIGRDGSLNEQPIQSVVTDEKAHAIVTDRTNRFAFVPHTGPNAVFQFRFDGHTGKLEPNAPAKLATAAQTGPRHIGLHPTANFAYFDNEQGSSVTACRLHPSMGTLEPFQTLSTLPEGISDSNSCAHLEISPSGRNVYASNRGHDSIACFAVDANTGRLASLGQVPTERTPRSFNIDPSGRYLYAAGEGSGKLASYRVDRRSGKLERLATYEVGPAPWWVQVVAVGEKDE